MGEASNIALKAIGKQDTYLLSKDSLFLPRDNFRHSNFIKYHRDRNITNPGVVELATTAEALAGSDTTRAVTAAGLAARSYRAAIGGATSINVDHGLNTRDVNVQMYDASSYETVMAQVVRSTAARVVVTFNVAPSAGNVIILVTKVD